MPRQKRIVFLLFILFLCFSQKSFSNTTFQDTIAQFDKVAFKASLEKLKPKEFSRLFINEYRQDSLKATISLGFIKDNLLLSEDLVTQFWGNYALAHLYHSQMNLRESLLYADRLYEIAIKLKNDDLILSSLINKANFYYEFGDYEESMEYNLRAEELLKKTNNIIRELAITYNIALIKLQTNDNLGAIELLKKMIAIINSGAAGTLNNLKTSTYIALIKGYIGIEDYEQARVNCEKVMELSRSNNFKKSKFYGLSFLGTIERINKNYKKAHQWLDESLIIAEEIKTVNQEIPVIYFRKGKVFYEEKKFKAAIDILLKANALMRLNKLDLIQLEETYALLAKSYNEIGDIKNSIKFYEKANNAYKKNDKRQGSINVDIIKKYDLAELKEELNVAQEKSKNKSTLLYIALSSIIVLIVSFALLYKYKKIQNKKKFEKLLSEAEPKKEVQTLTVSKTNTNDISEKITSEILEKLKAFEAKELYLKKNTSLSDVASKLKTNPKYLSKTVNKFKEKTFSNYIRDLRIQYVIHRLKNDTKFRSYTIEAIATEIGYKSTEPFSKAFKSKTGLYPSYFIKQLNTTEKI
ncbi:helix-turn-helix domain-containing protein [Kordia sp.]|uniref:helix-turn-helix domain-containing protein n=1 Tax=Kordia sp. TaxID=1965332 RepID=UPI003D6BB3CD